MIKHYLNEMPLVRYNANIKDDYVGDCTIRALSLAYNVPYKEVSRSIRHDAREKNKTSWYHYQYNSVDNFNKFIKEHGYEGDKIWNTLSPRMMVKDFAEEHPIGTYLILTGKKPSGRHIDHIIAVIDGDWYDSWDSSTQYVDRYCIVDSTEDVKLKDAGIKDLSSDEILSYMKKDFEEMVDYWLINVNPKNFTIVDYLGVKTFEKYPSFTTSKERGCSVTIYKEDNYTYKARYAIKTKESVEAESERFLKKLINSNAHYNEIVYKFTPKMTVDEIKAEIHRQTESWTKWMYGQFKKEKKVIDDASNFDNLRSQFPSLRRDVTTLDEWEFNILKKLPEKWKDKVIDVDWYNWEKQYQVRVKNLPDDENQYGSGVAIYGKNLKQINLMLDMYEDDVSDYGHGKDTYDYDYDY